MILTLSAFGTAFSIGCVGAGGWLIGVGYFGYGLTLLALGTGWNAILYSSLLRWISTLQEAQWSK